MLQAQIELRSVADLKANPRNARTHSPKQISQIAASIAEFGYTSPILIDGNDMVFGRHRRLEAAKKSGPVESSDSVYGTSHS
jgi:ParB-like chromosome segregation protein Spo0J